MELRERIKEICRGYDCVVIDSPDKELEYKKMVDDIMQTILDYLNGVIK